MRAALRFNGGIGQSLFGAAGRAKNQRRVLPSYGAALVWGNRADGKTLRRICPKGTALLGIRLARNGAKLKGIALIARRQIVDLTSCC